MECLLFECSLAFRATSDAIESRYKYLLFFCDRQSNWNSISNKKSFSGLFLSRYSFLYKSGRKYIWEFQRDKKKGKFVDGDSSGSVVVSPLGRVFDIHNNTTNNNTNVYFLIDQDNFSSPLQICVYVRDEIVASREDYFIALK